MNKPEILFEDEHIIAAVKPRGISTHPGAGKETDTFMHALAAHTTLSNIGAPDRPGIVHRLDKDTSGILVAAKTDQAHLKLAEIFSEKSATRKYTAFVWGVPNWDRAEITGNIQRSKRNRKKMALVKVGGKPATTLAETVSVWPRAGVSELKCELITGRTHQIRVHLTTHGFPLIGDKTYGKSSHRINSIKPTPLLEFFKNWTGGQMLHAGTLDFNHPITGKPLKLRAPLPEDLKLLKSLLDDYQSAPKK